MSLLVVLPTVVDAREYHDRTNHTVRGVREDEFTLDYANQPRPYKRYEDLPRISPSGPPEGPDRPALAAVARTRADPAWDDGREPPDGPPLYALAHYATGVTKSLERGGRTMRFRAASCTGKLYHVDLYAVCGDTDSVDAGVYHFDPDGDRFDLLREGDYRGVLAAATGDRATVADAPVTFVATSEWWRNAWKYRERTYRHAFWDSGTILANLLATAHGLGHSAEVVTAFDDASVAALLGVDPETEAPLELVPVGRGDAAPDPVAVEPIDPETTPVSERVVDYPLVSDAWRQSTLPDGTAAREWREDVREFATDTDALGTHPPGEGERVALDPVDADTASARPVDATIKRRGSLREYGREPIGARLFATVLDRALRGPPIDALDPDARLLDCYCLVHGVEDVPSGAYQYHPRESVLERVGETDRRTAGHLALDQPVVGRAAANVYLLADVDRLVERFGNRGYRLAQLAGGLALGRLYLATYAHLALGGRGFTFYDERVTDHLSPRASNQSPICLFAFGPPKKDE